MRDRTIIKDGGRSMRPKITDAHLQNTLRFMAEPLPYRQLFFESADTFPPLFLLLDKKTTYREIIRTKNKDIEPSSFGDLTIRFANIDFITDHGALIPLVAQEFDPTSREALKHFATHVFLNLAWWYTAPIFWAINFQCPYMPESWMKTLFAQKVELPLQPRMEYLDSIVDFIQSQDASVQLFQGQKLRWITPYEDISGQLGLKGQYFLRDTHRCSP